MTFHDSVYLHSLLAKAYQSLFYTFCPKGVHNKMILWDSIIFLPAPKAERCWSDFWNNSCPMGNERYMSMKLFLLWRWETKIKKIYLCFLYFFEGFQDPSFDICFWSFLYWLASLSNQMFSLPLISLILHSANMSY